MAERGDLIGCTVLFEMAENGEVPISFTLNGKPITQARISIRIFQENSLLFPFVSMGHEGVAVSAKVSNILSLFSKHFRLKILTSYGVLMTCFPPNVTTSIPGFPFFASIVFDEKGGNGERMPEIQHISKLLSSGYGSEIKARFN